MKEKPLICHFQLLEMSLAPFKGKSVIYLTGEDSKTLMLVHVSPKEEDLCETICSLNFATRVKSIHLGHWDSNEVRDQKEASMKNLQQKMRNIEEERLRVRGEIGILNGKLETLTRPAHSFQEKLEGFHSSVEEALSNPKTKKNKIGDVTAAPLSQLPRFMRPTFCSRRKSGMDLHTSVGKDQHIRRRRTPSSHRAESMTLPVKNNSEYNSEHSISRASCLADLNMKQRAEYETEYSQETLECDINIVAFPEQDTSESTSIQQRAPFSHFERCGIQKTKKFNCKKSSKVDDWLSHKNETTFSGFTHRSKRVLAIPVPDKKHRERGPMTAQSVCKDSAPTYEFAVESIVGHNEIKKQLDVNRTEVLISEVNNEKPQTMLKDLFEMESRLDCISLSHVMVGQTMIKMQDFLYCSSMEDNAPSTSSLSESDMCSSTLDQYKDDDVLYTMSITQPVKGEMHCLDAMLKNGGCMFSPSESDNSILNRKEIVVFPSQYQNWNHTVKKYLQK